MPILLAEVIEAEIAYRSFVGQIHNPDIKKPLKALGVYGCCDLEIQQ